MPFIRCVSVRRKSPFGLPALLVLALAACPDDNPVGSTDCLVSAISVTIGSTSIEVGATTNVSAALTTQRCSTAPTVTWRSSAENVASVSASGQVTGVGQGTATITGTAVGVSNSVNVEVRPVPVRVASLEITPAQTSIALNASVQLTAVTKAANGTPLTGRTVTWQSLTPNVVTVGASGLVVGVGAGTGIVEATSETIKSQATITVQPPPSPPATVSVTLAASAIGIGRTTQATAVIKDAQGNTLTNHAVTWFSSSTNVASVSTTGLVTAQTVGTASIRADVNGFPSVTNSATVTVVAAFAVANIDDASTSSSNAPGFNSSGGSIVFTRTTVGAYRLTFNGLGIGGIGSRFAVFINAKSDLPNTTLAASTAACTLVGVTTAQPLELNIRCENPFTTQATDDKVRFRAVVIGDNSLVAGSTPYAFTTHNNLTATAPYAPPSDMSFNSNGATMSIIPNVVPGSFSNQLIGHNLGVAPTATAALITSALAPIAGVVCITQADAVGTSLKATVCFTRSGPINAQHTMLAASSGRPGLPAAHAFVQSTGALGPQFSFSTGTGMTAARTGPGKYTVTFTGLAVTQNFGVLLSPFGTGVWRHCNHFVTSSVLSTNLTVDVACYGSSGSFFDSAFDLYIVQ